MKSERRYGAGGRYSPLYRGWTLRQLWVEIEFCGTRNGRDQAIPDLVSHIKEQAKEIERLQAPLPEDLERRVGELEDLLKEEPEELNTYITAYDGKFLTTTIRALQARKVRADKIAQGLHSVISEMRCERAALQAELTKEREQMTPERWEEIKDYAKAKPLSVLDECVKEIERLNAVASDKANTEESQ